MKKDTMFNATMTLTIAAGIAFIFYLLITAGDNTYSETLYSSPIIF